MVEVLPKVEQLKACLKEKERWIKTEPWKPSRSAVQISADRFTE